MAWNYIIYMTQYRASASPQSNGIRAFVMSVLELKLDTNMMFQQMHRQADNEVSHFHVLYQLSCSTLWTSVSEQIVESRYEILSARRPSILASQLWWENPIIDCVACVSGKHPLYVCLMLKSMPHEKMMFVMKTGHLYNLATLSRHAGSCFVARSA